MDYREMYYTLFRAVTSAVDILQQAQRETEEIYLSTSPDISILEIPAQDEKDIKE